MTESRDPRRLLWVTYDFPPRQAAGAFRPVKLYKYLDKSELAIEFLTSRAESFAGGEHLLDDVHPQPLVRRAGGIALDRIFELPKHLLVRAGLASAAKRSLWERLGYRLLLPLAFPDKHVLWGLSAAWRALILHLRGRFDAIYTTSHPESAHLPGMLLHLLGVPWIVDYRYGGPLWTATLKVGHKSLWGARLGLAYQRYVLRHADVVIVQSETIREQFMARFGLPPAGITALPNGYDEDGFSTFGDGPAPFARAAGELHLLHVGGDWYPDTGHIANLLDPLWIADHFGNGARVIIGHERVGPSQVFNRPNIGNILCRACLIGRENYRDRGQPQVAAFPHGSTTRTNTEVSVTYQLGHIGYLAVKGDIQQLIT